MARDLTAPWTFRGGSRPQDIWLRLTTGLPPSPMPSFADRTTPEERWDLANYVLTLAGGQPVMASTGVNVALARPVAQRLVRDAQIAAQPADRLGPGTNQLNRSRANSGG